MGPSLRAPSSRWSTSCSPAPTRPRRSRRGGRWWWVSAPFGHSPSPKCPALPLTSLTINRVFPLCWVSVEQDAFYRQGLPNIIQLLATVAIFLMVVYFQVQRVGVARVGLQAVTKYATTCTQYLLPPCRVSVWSCPSAPSGRAARLATRPTPSSSSTPPTCPSSCRWVGAPSVFVGLPGVKQAQACTACPRAQHAQQTILPDTVDVPTPSCSSTVSLGVQPLLHLPAAVPPLWGQLPGAAAGPLAGGMQFLEPACGVVVGRWHQLQGRERCCMPICEYHGPFPATRLTSSADR